jgi:hypothetical protein
MFEFCRDNNIFVDANSLKEFEFGTKAYPYKTIRKANIEVFNNYFLRPLDRNGGFVDYKQDN